MLSEQQKDRLSRNMFAAQVRAHYFGHLTTRYTRYKQRITGMSIFLSSGAFVTTVSTAPSWVTGGLALTSAAASAYSLASGLDRKVGLMAKLYSAWSGIADDYEGLSNHTDDADAEARMDDILRRYNQASELGLEAPNDERLMERCQQYVKSMQKEFGGR